LSKLEVEMRRIEDGVAEILNDLKYLRRREERMRDTNGSHPLPPAHCWHRRTLTVHSLPCPAESTNSRVAWLSIFSVVTMVAVGAWQIYYLKRYFQQKKIL
jgi:hypothetical protein